MHLTIIVMSSFRNHILAARRQASTLKLCQMSNITYVSNDYFLFIIYHTPIEKSKALEYITWLKTQGLQKFDYDWVWTQFGDGPGEDTILDCSSADIRLS